MYALTTTRFFATVYEPQTRGGVVLAEPIFFDDNFEAWMASIEAHGILAAEIRRMRQMRTRLTEVRGRLPIHQLGRVYQEVYGPSHYSAPDIDRQWQKAAVMVMLEDRTLTHRFAEPFNVQLKAHSEVSTTFGLRDLLLLSKPELTEAGGSHRRVEAIARYLMIRLMMEIDQRESTIDVGKQMGHIVRRLSDQLFVPERIGSLQIRATVDPKDKYRLSECMACVGIPPDLSGRSGVPVATTLKCRFYRDDPSIPIVIDDRAKWDFSTALKILRKGEWDLSDKRGITLIFMNDVHLSIVRRELDQMFQADGAWQIHEVIDNFDGGRLSQDNADSSNDFKAVRFELMYFDPHTGRYVPVEINLLLLSDYIESRYCRTPKNHMYYRFNQLRRAYFPLRFPRFVYGVDWRRGSRDAEWMQEVIGRNLLCAPPWLT